MGFQRVKYTTDAGTVVYIRASDATIGVTGNTAVTAAVDDPNVYAFASNPGSRKKKALNARGLTLQRFVGTGDARKTYRTFVPFFTKAALDAINMDTDITLNGKTYKPYARVSEA